MTDLISKFHNSKFFKLFYHVTKWALGIGFVLSGIRKLPGVKFTQIPIENPIGLFFEGMYATGFYWNFIGYYQIVVGILLVLPLWKKLTPLLIFPVTINIFLVSASLQMRGTPVITALILLGNLFLIFWHWKAYQPLLKMR